MLNKEIYQHYKGPLYQVVAVGIHSETEEELVIYHALKNPGQTWCRPLSMWNEAVTFDGKTVPRFKLYKTT